MEICEKLRYNFDVGNDRQIRIEQKNENNCFLFLGNRKLKICPTNNFEIVNGQVIQKDNCTICYRCVNACPKQAASVYLEKIEERTENVRDDI